jgi:hypothetical protein
MKTTSTNPLPCLLLPENPILAQQLHFGWPFTQPTMATRRPASSRAKTSNDIQPVHSRSVITKTVAGALSSRVSDDIESSSDPQRPRNKEDGETNIQVILCCCGRSEREIQENSLAIVQIEGLKSYSLTIETPLPISSLGMFSSPPPIPIHSIWSSVLRLHRAWYTTKLLDLC